MISGICSSEVFLTLTQKFLLSGQQGQASRSGLKCQLQIVTSPVVNLGDRRRKESRLLFVEQVTPPATRLPGP